MYKDMIPALTPPQAPQLAIKIFNFIQEELKRSIRYIPGMQPIPDYIDKQYIRQEMKAQLNMDFDPYAFIVPMLEDKIMESFNELKDS